MMAVTANWEYIGIWSRELTLDQLKIVSFSSSSQLLRLQLVKETYTFERGRAPSRANAQKTRPVLNCALTTQGPRAMKRINVKPKAPPAFWATWRNNSTK